MLNMAALVGFLSTTPSSSDFWVYDELKKQQHTLGAALISSAVNTNQHAMCTHDAVIAPKYTKK